MNKMRWGVVLLVLPASAAFAEGPAPWAVGPATPGLTSPEVGTDQPSPFAACCGAESESGPLAGNHNFDDFINFVSNPLQNIDPRAVTAIYPIFGSSWVSTAAPFPDSVGQVYAPAITVALSERLAVGLDQGGYAYLHLNRSELARLAALDPQGRFRDIEAGGVRQGWLNLGAFAQYTLVEDVPAQFLLTGGLRVVTPSGSTEVFQGREPWLMAPYLTVGKGLGEFHVLATAGYRFPFAGSGHAETEVFYANVHFDRRCFGWLYPLVEFNSSYHTTSTTGELATREGFIDLGNFENEGNIVAMAVGANAVIVKGRLEFGAVYTTVLASQRNFGADGMLVKMTLRY